MKYFCGLLFTILFLGTTIVRADDPDEAYVEAYSLVQQADALNASGKRDEALAKYLQAQAALRTFQKNHAEFKPRVVTYRANYVAQKITELSSASSSALGTGAASGTPAGSAATQSHGSALPPGVVIKLIDPGSEPRKALRLHPKPGEKQTCQMIMKMAMAMKMMETNNLEIKLPPVAITMEASVKSVSADGDIAYTSTTTDATVGSDEPGVMPQVAEAMKASLANIKGLTANGVISSRGFNKGTDMKIPAGGDPQVRQVMDQMKDSFSKLSAPLPDEPIGPGAKWEVKMPLKSGGITMEQSATYQLVSLENDKVVLKTTLAQRAAPQKVENPSMPGLKMDLSRLSGTGTGESTFDLGKILPNQAAMDVQSEATMSANTGGQKQETAIKFTVNMTMEAK